MLVLNAGPKDLVVQLTMHPIVLKTISITVWTVVHTVFTAISQSNGNGQTLTTHRIQTPLTDYDKTLHNWLRPRDEHVSQNLCQSTLRGRLGKYVKYKALSFFYSDLFFSRTRLLKWSVDRFSRRVSHITRNHARKCLFWVCTMAENI